ncbi:hypothetical protein QYM46_13000 [Brevibacterium sp. K11IcPPYGO002]|uniref:hypothetical protein n=1 Tax=Brevibacterium sp. K11IcPPYGO002 TaxID=3058837 RepID=UPI003D818A44
MTLLKETATLTPKAGGRAKIGIITPGTGSSGVYPKETIEAAGRDKVFGQGLHMYLDHATEAQDWERPEGSLRDLVGVLTEDAHWDDDVGGLVAEAKIFSHWKPIIAEMAEDIGVSIRASGEVSESSGQRVVTKLTEARSVDFVTKAGRGGKVLELLESARFNEATAEEIRRLLQDAIKNEHGAENTWVWLRDYDEAHVWFDLDTDDSNTTLEQAYTIDGVNVTLTGTATEVVPTTTFVPKQTNPAPSGKETQESDSKEKNTMEISEADHKALTDKAGRVEQLETDLAEARKKIEAAEAEKAKEVRRAEVATIVEEAFDGVDPGMVKDLLIDRLAESDTTGDDLIKEARTFAEDYKTKTAGTGQVRGLGESRPVTTDTTATESELPSYDELTALKGA